MVSDLSLDPCGDFAGIGRMQMGREGDVVLVNGQVRPQIVAAPGSGNDGESSMPALRGICGTDQWMHSTLIRESLRDGPIEDPN